ncbi:MAG TPA: shikimate dehydrogenase [Fermentimonas caenicola]|jgi:shikimate dehydrogenase|uniref:shikimate dehydrogenase family protein n=1 Tax=Lascolabacillus sp. TaxID=1924068 RepID=UPI0017ADB46C|nr:shikimate dehydrogenase [Lascolabacillus sp.]HHU41393.1 shikimate dehydrogenase [Fermentimonas caenicola]MCK9501011.1 shikimate dehydrogenase [Lascolabacillus sp.]MDD2607073.1 shikimate dehydrogenase [Lascolabacillus sp.]MDD3658593.1 shikimate dehydrogenase [Lascolabacillus sp.]MDD4757878.1 shikimate dehydrogenase [Lascolabacillus sp.]
MDTYGLIGFPLKHSFSAGFFTEKFRKESIEAEYLNFEIEDILEIRRVILFNQHLKGLNVTIPYKEKVIPFLNNISDEAEKIGAVNVIKVLRKPGDMYFYELTGYNTDYIGFRDSLLPLLKPGIDHKALILGTGGASKAVSQVLTDIDIEWSYVSRSSKNKAIKGRVMSYNDLSQEVMSTYNIIVNASPVGTFPDINSCPDIPYKYLTPGHILYDLVYNPEETLFLKKGKEIGASIKNGQEMLELQALAAWEIWNS